MKEDNRETAKKVNKKQPMDDILSIIKQFVGYFEEVDQDQVSAQTKVNRQ